jgi:hypothetical protein
MSRNDLYEDQDGVPRAHVQGDAVRGYVAHASLADTAGGTHQGHAVADTYEAALGRAISNAQANWEANGRKDSKLRIPKGLMERVVKPR